MSTQSAFDFVLQAFTAYVDGFGKAGSGEEVTLPKIKKKTEAFRGGGMLGERSVSLGYDKLQFMLSLNSFDPQVMTKGGLYVGNKSLSFSVRGYLDGDNNAQHTAICQMSGEVTELDAGAWQAGKKAMLKSTIDLYAAKLTIDNAEVYTLDFMNGVYSFGGNDAGLRLATALGF